MIGVRHRFHVPPTLVTGNPIGFADIAVS